MRTLAGALIICVNVIASLVSDIMIRPVSNTLAEEWDTGAGIGLIFGVLVIACDFALFAMRETKNMLKS